MPRSSNDVSVCSSVFDSKVYPAFERVNRSAHHDVVPFMYHVRKQMIRVAESKLPLIGWLA